MPDFAEGVMREFAEDRHLQCQSCGTIQPSQDTSRAQVVDGTMSYAVVAWRCGYCGESNDTLYVHERD